MTLDELLEVGTAELKEATITATDQPDLPMHTFSPRFERRMGRLLRRSKHPVLYRAVRMAACIALALLLAGGAVLTVVPDARAAVEQWFVEAFGRSQLFQFHVEPTEREVPTDRSFTLTGLPEGYTEVERWDETDDGECTVIYTNEEGLILFFRWNFGLAARNSYYRSAHESGHLGRVDTFVGNDPAVYLYEADGDGSSALIWYDNQREVYFDLMAWGDLDELLRMAESIEE